MLHSPIPSKRPDATLRSLSPARQLLVRAAQQLCFGTIHQLQITGAQPVVRPFPRTVRRKKSGGSNLPRPESNSADFALRREWVDFFADLDAIGEGLILSIEIAHGMPIVYEFEDVIRI